MGLKSTDPRDIAWNKHYNWFKESLERLCGDHPEFLRNVQRVRSMENKSTVVIAIFAVPEVHHIFNDELCAALSTVLSSVLGVCAIVHLNQG